MSLSNKDMGNLYKKIEDIESLLDRQLIIRLFKFLDHKEESSNMREFNPVTIGCCRAMMHEPLDQVLMEMKSRC